MRLGVYADLVYRSQDGRFFTDRAFITLVSRLAARVSELVLFGRLDPTRGRMPYELPEVGVRFVPLPHYSSWAAIARMLTAVPASARTVAAELERLDCIWLFGPHPLSLVFARIARSRGVPVVLGVRQDFPQYVAAQLPSRRWLWAVPVAHGLERAFRRLGSRAPAVVVGEDLARKYAGGSAPVLPVAFSLVADSDVVSVQEALGKSWQGPLRLLSVGRLDLEKNPILLPEILAALRRRDDRWTLAVVGEGPLAPAVARRAAELGVADALELRGYVPYGPALWAEYRRSHAFLHVSLTEGLPQVLAEAHAAGLPIVATDVGGVAAALGEGGRGLLVPPGDVQAAVDAVERLRTDEPLRRRLVQAGLAHAAGETLDTQLDRITQFLYRQVEVERA